MAIDRPQNHRSRGDTRIFTDFDIAEDFSAGADHCTLADLRMTIGSILARTAQGDALQEGHVILNHRRLTDDQPGRMIQENPTAETGCRMDIGLKDLR